MTDTIFGLSSGQVPAGVAVIRISGPGARAGLEKLTDSVPEPRVASLRNIRSPEREVIDRALVTFFPAPRSFTGEDTAEISGHGGRAVVSAVLSALSEIEGFRPAEPGEFTRRAFLNRRLDLTEVEGLADLIRAETDAQRRAAQRQAGGALRRQGEAWRARLLRWRALIEANLDFSDEGDVADGSDRAAWDEVGRLAGEIEAELDRGGGERLRDGLEVVISGPPNVGKSSLVNALARRDVAIVTAEPGTTRDALEVRLDLGGFPVTVVDTAGLRETDNSAEREGVKRAGKRAEHADLVVWLEDLTNPARIPPPANREVVRVGTKLDLIDSEQERGAVSVGHELCVSAVTGDGLDALEQRITEFAKDRFQPAEASLISRGRQRSALKACAEALRAAGNREIGMELRAEELRRASDALGRLAGRLGVEELLDEIFREFCIGK